MDAADARHALRRFAFAATPAAERAFRPLSPEAGLAALVQESRRAALPAPPEPVRTPWTNSALRTTGVSAAQGDTMRAAQIKTAQRDIELVRRWWLRELTTSAAPLRENLVLFFHGMFGTATATVDIPHALYGYNQLLRRHALGTFPALLESLVVDSAMLIQIGMDEHGRDRVSDRPAKLILDNWTVGAGAYADSDVENLSRAITGWALRAPGVQPAADPRAPLALRRAGIVPTFNRDQFDATAKTILGTTRDFDAKAAIGFLARHPATARRFSGLLIRYFGVEDSGKQLEAALTKTYVSSDGSIEALLGAIAASKAFLSNDSRWSLMKSPVHLAAGACRQLGIAAPPLAEISQWLAAAGQTLFDTPNAGEGTWPGGNAWVTPPDRLAVRYQLPVVLGGRVPAFGLAAPRPDQDRRQAPLDIPTAATLSSASAVVIVDRLDPVPGLETAAGREATKLEPAARSDLIRRVMMSPQYQLA